MKDAFCGEVRYAGHRNAGCAAASRRLTVGRPFKAGTSVSHQEPAPRQRRLISHPVGVCHLIRRSATGYWVRLPRPGLKGRPTVRCRYAAMKMSKLQEVSLSRT